jgi:hypothetical protein
VDEKPAVVEDAESQQALHLSAAVASQTGHLTAVVPGHVRLDPHLVAVSQRFDLADEAI